MLQKQVKSINRHGPFHLKTFVFFWILQNVQCQYSILLSTINYDDRVSKMRNKTFQRDKLMCCYPLGKLVLLLIFSYYFTKRNTETETLIKNNTDAIIIVPF